MKPGKFKRCFFITILLLTGCLSEQEFEPAIAGGIPINLDGEISQISTKVTAQGFEDGDALGLYAVNYVNSNQTPGILKDEGNQADHVKYIFDESNWKWNPVRPIYYKDANTNVDLYAFYPYAEPTSVSAYTFEVQKDQSSPATESRPGGYEASDFLWAKAENITPTETAIKMTLNHKMAGVHVILKEGTGFEQAGDFKLIGKKVLVTNTTRKSTINLADGTVSPVGGAQATGIVMCPQTDGSFRAVVIPQTVEAGTKLFSITIEGVSYNFAKNVDVKYVSGKLNTFTITINRKYPSGEYELILSDSQIVDWKEDINTHEGEARQYYCVRCDEPGSLGHLIKADKKNPDKIKNLKVSGKISDEDFYFMRDSMAILEAVNLKECKVIEVGCGEEIWGNLPNGEWGITGYTETQNDVIPSKAFMYKKTLYYFTFPEVITKIDDYAFSESSLSGTLVIPNDVTSIMTQAFYRTNISRVEFSSKLKYIGQDCFSNIQSLSGPINFPSTLEYIGDHAFADGGGLSGILKLPSGLVYIGAFAFHQAGHFTGDLHIPEKITKIGDFAFHDAGFTGSLYLNNVTDLGASGRYSYKGTFSWCGFKGELVIPEGTTTIPEWCFTHNSFSSLSLPSSLRTIAAGAFESNIRLCSAITFPYELINIGAEAFSNCNQLTAVEFPATLQSIETGAFKNCFKINMMVSKSSEPPIIQTGAFDGVAKDNFMVEVPENAVSRYKADSQWGEFRRISAHHDFSISRSLARSLNAETSKTYILRAPANYEWSIESKPDWVTVSPSSGTGETEVTVRFAEMADAEVGTFEIELTDDYGNYKGTTTYNGRAGEIVFLLNDKDYRSKMTVEQYDYEYGDGDVLTLNEATKGNGVNLVFLADCYDAKDIATGNYLKDVEEAYRYYFDVEPYKTYKEYFNVYTVFGESDDSGMGTVNTIRDAKFGSQYSLEGISPDFETCYEYAQKANPNINPSQTLIVMVENTTEYGGICYMWGDGSAIACCPKSTDAYPYDFRGIVQHEAGGHGFGKLADEYIYHNAFIQSCDCFCCEHLDKLLGGKELGWYRNLEITGDVHEVGWAHMIFHPQYSNVVDVYEGGYFHSSGVYRSEPTSCMNNNIPYYSAISRQAIVERIMEYAGEEFSLEHFYARDSDEFGSTTTRSFIDALSAAPLYDNGKQFAPKYMGDKPDFVK